MTARGMRCGNPYLQYHHFDPPWHVKQSHDPAGMIAICAEHHAKADAGAYTVEQLRELKKGGHADVRVSGAFDWMRREMLTVVGGYYSREGPVALEVRDHPVIGFTRDPEGYKLLNLELPSLGPPRLKVVENDWELLGDPDDFACPPNGRVIDARYANGDRIRVEFFNVRNRRMARERIHEHFHRVDEGLDYPFTAVQITLSVPALELDIQPKRSILPRQTTLENVMVKNGVVIR